MADRIKKEIARAIQDELVRYGSRIIGRQTDGAVDEELLEVHQVDALNTAIRYKTDQGPRYFLVKISEQY